VSFLSLEFLCFVLVTLAVFWIVDASRRVLVIALASGAYALLSDITAGALAIGVVALCVFVGPRLRSTNSNRWLAVALGCMGAVFVGLRWARANPTGELATLTGVGLVNHLSLSYFLFHAVSYVVDVHRRRIEPQPAAAVAGFVGFFPHMAAGPVMRTRRTFRTFAHLGEGFDARTLVRSGHFVLLGVFRKVVVADGIIWFVSSQNELSRIGPLQLMGLVFAAYHDVGGYNDMARGIALLFGVELQANFRQPFSKSTGFLDLWTRWQTTLMQWFRDYVYTPLRGDGRNSARRAAALPVAVVCSSVWHGFSWRWLAFGGILGVLVVLDRKFNRTRPKKTEFPTALVAVRRSLTLAVVSPLITAPLLFTTGDQALGRISLQHVSVANGFGFLGIWYFVMPWLFTLFLERFEVRRGDRDPLDMLSIRGGLIVGAMLTAIIVFWGGSPLPFVYARF
jgi:alginate O-acetyltransferase complex protein AlgI